MRIPRALHIGLLAALVATALALVGPAAPAGAAPTSCLGRAADIVAVAGQVTRGTSGADVIVGSDGDDIIIAGGGDDLICAAAGSDQVWGNGGDDRIVLGTGDDAGWGGRGRDHLQGQAGYDTVDGGPGVDACPARRGNDAAQRCEANNRPGAGGIVAALEARMVDRVNAVRRSVGVDPVEAMPELADVARAWSATLPDEFAHNPNVGDQIPNGWRTWGENIGYRMDPSRTTQQNLDAIQASLEASPGHYANMTASFFDSVGIGVVVIGDSVYVTQVFAQY